MEYKLHQVLKQFNINTEMSSYGNGYINDTYIAKPYILQRINSNVFKNPEGLMENIAAITEHLRKKILLSGGNPDRETLTIIKTKDGEKYYKTNENDYFRVYKFIDNAVTYDEVEDPMQFYYGAKAFGKFQNMLSDFPVDKLYDTIPNFHNTATRFEDLLKAIEDNKCGRLEEVGKEIEFVKKRRRDVSIILDAMKDGSIPLRVTHNDTKLNNVMIDIDTGEGVCVIDLDTVMPGSLLYDYGDALRYGASSGSEDETDLSKIWFDMNLFKYFTKGYFHEVLPILVPKEIELMAFSVKLMTFECGIRFLTDYLNGDIYFKIHKEKHNLHRARTQFKLVSDIEGKMDIMNKIIRELIEGN